LNILQLKIKKRNTRKGVDRTKIFCYNKNEQGKPIDGQPSVKPEITASTLEEQGGYFFFLSMYLNTSNKSVISATIKPNNK